MQRIGFILTANKKEDIASFNDDRPRQRHTPCIFLGDLVRIYKMGQFMNPRRVRKDRCRMPKASESKRGTSAPSSLNWLRSVDSYRAAASSGGNSPSMRKTCSGFSGTS